MPSAPPDFLDARQAASILGVKLATLYSYVSRGWVRSIPGDTGAQKRLYHRGDIERLAARRSARAGHAATASGALRWGEPVLDSAVCAISPDGPLYRGHSAVALAERGLRFENVAELLWTELLSEAPVLWRLRPSPLGLAAAAALGPRATPLEKMACALPAVAAGDGERHGAARKSELERGRRLLHTLVDCLGRETTDALGDCSIAERLLHAFRVEATSARIAAVNQALILCADHELNVSTFAARVVASAGADLYACVAAGVAALSGPRHGGSCDRVEALLADIGHPRRAGSVARARIRRGESLPGFGHPLYPGGDPRARALLGAALEIDAAQPDVAIASALCRSLERGKGQHPNLDLGLVAIAASIGLPVGSAVALFAVGRVAGWIAHVSEQRGADFLLRPRARYIGRKSP